MTTWLVHGFNVSDGGDGSINRLAPHLSPVVQEYRYGWTGLVGLSCANRRAVRGLLQVVRPGDSLVAHSNGCLIAWQLARMVGRDLRSVVCVNPALRRDTLWNVPVLCLHNSTDWVVQLGRAWGRLFPVDGIEAQGWGAAGRYGFTAGQEHVTNLDTSESWLDRPVKGHSGLFREPEYWGSVIDSWMLSRG